jgi:hypothetical protein
MFHAAVDKNKKFIIRIWKFKQYKNLEVYNRKEKRNIISEID